MRNDGPQGLGLGDVPVGQKSLVYVFGPLEVSRLAIPQATIGGVVRDGLPHVLGQSVLDPLQVGFSVHLVRHVHFDWGVEDVVGVAPVPGGGVDGAYLQLYQVEKSGGHGRSDVFPGQVFVEDRLVDVVVSLVPGLRDGLVAELFRVHKTEPGIQHQEWVVDVGLGVAAERPLDRKRARGALAHGSRGRSKVGLLFVVYHEGRHLWLSCRTPELG